MKSFEIRYWCLLAVIATTLIIACHGCRWAAGPVDLGERGPDAVVAGDPDALAALFIQAWESMDPALYRDGVLYDGALPAVDGRLYAPFCFYFEDYGRRPEHYQRFAEEVANVERMFSGRPSRDGRLPGIASIDIRLTKEGDWLAVAAPRIGGDDTPPGAQRCTFGSRALFRLKNGSSCGDESQAISGFAVDRRQEFVVIPVSAGQGRPGGYRLWKWFELSE
jgi:hypothetical protein